MLIADSAKLDMFYFVGFITMIEFSKMYLYVTLCLTQIWHTFVWTFLYSPYFINFIMLIV